MPVRHAEAKNEVLENIGNNQTKQMIEELEDEEVKGKENEKKQATKPPAYYREAVKDATSTIIIQVKEDRNAEVEQQVRSHVKEHHGNVKRVRKISNWVKLVCESAKDAQKLKRVITEDCDALNIRNESLRKERVIILNIPRWVAEEQVLDKIERILGINRKEFTEDVIKLLKPKEAKNERKHIPVIFPEPLMDHLLGMPLLRPRKSTLS